MIFQERDLKVFIKENKVLKDGFGLRFVKMLLNVVGENEMLFFKDLDFQSQESKMKVNEG